MGFVAMLLMSAGTPYAQVAAAPAPAQQAAVRRGDRVLLTVRVGAVLAAVEAEALQDGAVGQTIRVRNLQNGRVQLSRVLRPGQVEVMPQ